MNNQSSTLPDAAMSLMLDYVPLSIPLANAIGIKESILVKMIANSCYLNESEKDSYFFQNNNWWADVCCQKIAKHSPYLGDEKDIKKMIRNLEGLKVLLSGVFAKDKSKWYRVDEKTLYDLVEKSIEKQSCESN